MKNNNNRNSSHLQLALKDSQNNSHLEKKYKPHNQGESLVKFDYSFTDKLGKSIKTNSMRDLNAPIGQQ
tara:strand:- start:319 stop:525 length:207 start_codon:yes stop_codon:yes gene_type:complete